MSFFDLPPIIERMLLVSDKISDLNFSVGQHPQVEINGKLTPVQPLGMQKLTPYQTEIIAMKNGISLSHKFCVAHNRQTHQIWC